MSTVSNTTMCCSMIGNRVFALSLLSLLLLTTANAEQETGGVKIIAPNPQASGTPTKRPAKPQGGI